MEGEVVYANFGTEDDFEKLTAMGVSLKNKIVIARQGQVFRGNKVCYLYLELNNLSADVTELWFESFVELLSLTLQ